MYKRQESNPCSLCAKMRRGIIHDTAKKAGCNKVALGHHFDDAVETFMLNLLHEGRLGSFSPKTYLDRRDTVSYTHLDVYKRQNLNKMCAVAEN